LSALIDEIEVRCPCCGEAITLVVDLSVPEQDYIEDCFVCCRPIRVICRTDDGAFAGIDVSSTDG